MSSRLTLRALRLYQRADVLSGVLICFMVVFSPWAFGTTQPWSIWTMNLCGYALGLLLAAKLFIRFRRGYRPSRWDDRGTLNTEHRTLNTDLYLRPASPGGASVPASRLLTSALALLTVLILAYCLIAALNARATYDWSQGSLIYHECLRWLPHSYDAPSTWRAFWNYLALALFFWSLRDWLLGLSNREIRTLVAPKHREGGTPSTFDVRPSTSPPGGASVPASRPSSPHAAEPASSQLSEFQLSAFKNAPPSDSAPDNPSSIIHHPSSAESIPSSFVIRHSLVSDAPSSPGGASVPASRSAPGGEMAGVRCPPSSIIHHPSSKSLLLPQRLRWLLWLLSLNGALLAVEGIAQRMSGTNKLLWFMPTRLNREALSQFGPFAYRANGAQYLNLIWPVTLGFWWALRRQARRQRESARGTRTGWRHLLLPCILVMAAAPIISTSRGGAIVAVGMVCLAGVILMFAMRRRHPLTRFFAVLFLCAVFAVGAYLGGDQLMERMREFGPNLELRENLYASAHSMRTDSPLFGLGPGAFATMFQFYLPALGDDWLAQLHNDWSETLITFGWVGSALIALAFLLTCARSFTRGGLAIRWPFAALIGLALAGCLVHARWDFPFQIYSILFVFLALCALLSILTLRPLGQST